MTVLERDAIVAGVRERAALAATAFGGDVGSATGVASGSTRPSQPVTHLDPVFRAPWSALDDAALLAHWRRPRGVEVDLVVDADECAPRKIDALLDGGFEFNGETHHLADPLDWLRNPSVDVEWHILLHKFYYAPGLGRAFLASGDARYARRWAALIDGWMRTTPVGFIAADVTGRRVQNWVYSLVAFADHRAAHVAPVEPSFFRRLLRSLHEQVEFLCTHLTPKRNHRTLELLAIFLAGVALPEMARAAHWREFALAETLANLRADLLADGVHCELSSDYHHLALRNWLHVRTLAARHSVAVPPEMDALLQRALEFSLHVHKPDGVVPSLSDGDARSFVELLARGAELFGRDDLRWAATHGVAGRAPARTLAWFADSGYAVLRSGWGSGPHDYADAQYLVFDCGPLGEGNHGHFDALSFELAAHGRSLIVDPGRYTYSEAGDTNWRVHFRGTAAHNTVCVDGRQQTAYRPKPVRGASQPAAATPRHKISGPAPQTTLLEAAHGPSFTLLHGRAASAEYDAVHERVMVFVDAGYWIVSDWLRGETGHDYVLNFQLAPAAADRTTLAHDAGGVIVSSPGLLLAQPARDGVDVVLHEGWVSPRYGYKHRAPALRSRARGVRADFDTVLLPWRAAEPALTVREVSVVGDGGATGTALRVALSAGDDGRVDTWFHARGAAPQVWRIGAGLRFEGRWLHLRTRGDGSFVGARVHAGAVLHGAAGELPIEVVAAAVEASR